MIRTLKEIIKDAKNYLQGDFVLEDIFWLIEDTFNLQRYEILLKDNELFDDEILMARIKEAVEKPVSYILGYKEFYAYKFFINHNVLIPRNETEELVQMVLNDIKKGDKEVNILDIGTGSGCIAITLDLELRKLNYNSKIFASDISLEALKVAKLNNEKLKGNVQFFCSDVFDSIPILDVDIIVSNPPYINKNNFVAERVLNNEPHLALFADDNGLEIYHRIIKYVSEFYPKVTMYFEISPDLEEGLILLTEKYLPKHFISFYNDIYGLKRFAKISIK